MLIGINGRLGSGKDTVYERAQVVRSSLGLPKPERLAFADPLKDSACAVLGITREDMERMKRSEEPCMTVWDGEDVHEDMTMRLFLQRYGTEAHRQIFGDDFWVKATLPDGFDHEHRLVMVTDCRFPNEAARIHELGGYVVQVTDGKYVDAYEHESEKPLHDDYVDYTLINDVKDDHFVTLDGRVREMLETIQQWDGDTGF